LFFKWLFLHGNLLGWIDLCINNSRDMKSGQAVLHGLSYMQLYIYSDYSVFFSHFGKQENNGVVIDVFVKKQQSVL